MTAKIIYFVSAMLAGNLAYAEPQTESADQSTELKQDISEIKLAFKYKPVPKSLITAYVGVAPQGTFNKEGWSGATEFFTKDGIGNCSYGAVSIPVSHISAKVAAQSASYDVNDKVSLIDVTGNKFDGYIYNIKWFDDMYYHELECANTEYSPGLNKAVIMLAKDIDKSQSE